MSKRKTKTDTDLFKSKFRKILKEHNPNTDIIKNVLSKTYPYSFEHLVEINQKLKISKLEDKRTELIEHLDFLKSLDAHQEVLYKKLKEIEYNKFNEFNIKHLNEQLWMPSDLTNTETTIKEIEELEPIVEIVDSSNKKVLKDFNILRVMISSLEWNPNPGRLIRSFVKDKKTNKYLGVLTNASDFTTLQGRDDLIGWSDYHKYERSKLNNTSIGSSIVPVQPFGYNFLGGKLLACLSTSEVIRNEWKQRYGDVLIGNTTTSLYGDYSMYNSIPLWKKLGHSSGSILIKPDVEHYSFWMNLIKYNYKDDFDTFIVKTSPKQNVINFLFKICGIDKTKYKNDFHRGVYFSSFYKNGFEYLKDEIKESELLMDEKFNLDREWTLNWWKEKAIKRYLKLHSENKLQYDNLWYEDLKRTDIDKYLKAKGIYLNRN